MEVFKPYLDKISAILGFEVVLTRFNSISGGFDPVTAHNVSAYYLSADNKNNPYYIRSNYTDKSNVTVTHFRIVQFPGCCALAVSNGVIVSKEYRAKGVNTVAIQLRKKIAKVSGYAGLLATDVVHNHFSQQSFKRAGFKELFRVKNYRTPNTVNVVIADLTQEE
jgi:hypothetical protein